MSRGKNREARGMTDHAQNAWLWLVPQSGDPRTHVTLWEDDTSWPSPGVYLFISVLRPSDRDCPGFSPDMGVLRTPWDSGESHHMNSVTGQARKFMWWGSPAPEAPRVRSTRCIANDMKCINSEYATALIRSAFGFAFVRRDGLECRPQTFLHFGGIHES